MLLGFVVVDVIVELTSSVYILDINSLTFDAQLFLILVKSNLLFFCLCFCCHIQ